MALTGRPISEAPKDNPILAWCEHIELGDCEKCDRQLGRLCPYHAHDEGMSHVRTGWAIVVWGGGFDDGSYEYPGGASAPDLWFQYNTDFEVVANPINWWYLPEGYIG